MHILIAAHDFFPDPGSGGTGRYVHETGRRLVRRGHRVSVITRRRGADPVREAVADMDVYRFDITIAGRAAPSIAAQIPQAAATVARQVRRAGRVRPPDIASFQGPVTALLVDRVLDAAIPRVATVHSPWPTEYRIRTRGPEGCSGVRRRVNVALRRALEGRLLASTDGIVTLSRFMRDEVRREYPESGAATVVPGGVDGDRFTPDGPTLDRIDGDPAFLTVRRLSERMGHDLLLRAFGRVVDAFPEARLYIAGDGPLREHLEATARYHGVAEATTFLGYVPDGDLPALYRSADVFVLPTTELEGFGLATLEALATGLPVVATPVGGTVEILAPLESEPSIPAPLLVEEVSPQALAAGIQAWSRLPADRLQTVTRRCRRYSSTQFTWERTVTRLEELYARFVTGAG